MPPKTPAKPQSKGLWKVQDTWQANPHLAHNMPRLAANARLTVALKALMPDTLQVGWSAYLSEQTLTLKVPHNALATKIKQIAPLLLDGLTMTGWAITHMEVKVSRFNHPEWMSRKKTTTPTFTARILSAKSSARIQDSILHLPEDSPLRTALEKILSEHKAK
ncbi:MAG: hypothetical protein ACRCV6_08695 [Formosimonas sp.]